jgi:hypothetical protein
MKITALFAASVACASALEVKYVGSSPSVGASSLEVKYVGSSPDVGVSADSDHVKHGLLDDNHCEELHIPVSEFKSFWAADSWKYPAYTDGICEVPYTTYDDKTPDGDDNKVIHVKRGVGSTDVTVDTTPCGGDFTFSAGKAVKGSSLTITASGSLSESVTGGSYDVTANFGIISLVDSTANQGVNMKKTIKVLFTNFGDFSTNMFSVPASGDETFTLTMPVPNLAGTVTGKTTGTDQNGNQLWCMNFNMNL